MTAWSSGLARGHGDQLQRLRAAKCCYGQKRRLHQFPSESEVGTDSPTHLVDPCREIPELTPRTQPRRAIGDRVGDSVAKPRTHSPRVCEFGLRVRLLVGRLLGQSLDREPPNRPPDPVIDAPQA